MYSPKDKFKVTGTKIKAIMWYLVTIRVLILCPCLCCMLLPRYSDGKLKEADQILAINGQPLDKTVTHQQAIGILQSASDRVQLTVARGPIPQLASPAVSRTPSAASTLSANSSAVMSTLTHQWGLCKEHVVI